MGRGGLIAEEGKLDLLLCLLLLLLHLLLKLLVVSRDVGQLLLHLCDDCCHLCVLCGEGAGGVSDGRVRVLWIVSGRVADHAVSRCDCRTSGRRRRCVRA